MVCIIKETTRKENSQKWNPTGYDDNHVYCIDWPLRRIVHDSCDYYGTAQLCIQHFGPMFPHASK